MDCMDTGEPCTYVRTVVGANIASLCESSRLTQKTLAQMVGMNRSYLNELVAGKANPSLDKLVKIADALEVPITGLFAGIEYDAPRNLRVPRKGEGRPEAR